MPEAEQANFFDKVEKAPKIPQDPTPQPSGRWTKNENQQRPSNPTSGTSYSPRTSAEELAQDWEDWLLDS